MFVFADDAPTPMFETMLIYMSVGVVPANIFPLDWLKIVCAFVLSPGRPCVALVSTDAGLSLTAEVPVTKETGVSLSPLKPKTWFACETGSDFHSRFIVSFPLVIVILNCFVLGLKTALSVSGNALPVAV